MGRRPSFASAKSAAVHLSSPTWGGGGLGGFSPGLAGGTCGLHPDVAFCTRVRAARAEAVERIDNERQMFKFDIDGFDGLGGGEFVHRRDGQNRFALVQRFHGEGFFTLLVGLDHRAQIGHAVGRGGKIVLREDGPDAGHGQRFAQIKVLHASVGHGTQKQLAEQHAFGAEVFGIFRLAGHFRVEIRRGVVLADELVLRLTQASRPG